MALDMNSITLEVRDYISRNFLFSDKGFQYSDDASFLEEGIIDSLGIIELVAFVEKTFNLSIADHELLPSNFDSVSRLSSFIAGKLADGS